ncbi:hypothetical protein LCGC14_1104240 [marine sediment metagenome]|uniref:Uncharacterized protein n=1 Tax=marine sediment metagenome TaxID=412755 RepID=A0A0F9MWK6_9ZZZZ
MLETVNTYSCGCVVRSDTEHIDYADVVYCRMHDKAPLMLKALREISEGRGAYALDAYKHARNTIVDMKSIAVTTIAEVEETKIENV